MKAATRRSTACAAAAICATGAAIAIGGGAANASPQDATIVIRGNTPKTLDFYGPDSVPAGAELKIINKTGPRKVGPHSFSLAKRDYIPMTAKEDKECFPGGPCGHVARAHKINPETFEIGKAVVDKREKGWDAPFSEEHSGDSVFIADYKERHSRKVSAQPGHTLYFFCAVHPFMHGKIEVTE